MAITYNIQNRKGRVGKTETALNMAYGISQAGYKTLYIPFDPQANGQSTMMKDDSEITVEQAMKVREFYDKSEDKQAIMKAYKALASSGFSKERKYGIDINDVLKTPTMIQQAIHQTCYPNLDIIPASDELSMTDGYLKLSGKNPSGRLRTALSLIDNEYDVVIIDNSPFESSLTYNSICACYKEGDTIIIPVTISDRSIKGLGATLEILIEWLNEERLPYDCKLLITMKQRNKLTNEWIKTLRHIFPNRVFTQEIRFQGKPVESASLKNVILLEDKDKSNVQSDYRVYVDEILEDIRTKLGK